MDAVVGPGLPKPLPGQPRKQGLTGTRNAESPARFRPQKLLQDTPGLSKEKDNHYEDDEKILKERHLYEYPMSFDYLSIPYVESAVVRIVGSPYFESFGEMNHDSSVDEEAVQHKVLMYISGT